MKNSLKIGVLTLLSVGVSLAVLNEKATVEGFEHSESAIPDESKAHSFFISNSDCTDTLEGIDKAVRTVMRTERLKGGAALAISVGGRVVYARGYGYADIVDSVPMEPSHIMRVASVSKLITAVAVMRLVEEGALSLSQRVFGPVGVLNDEKYQTFRDSRMQDVTVENLLDHSGGWTAHYGDPMFMPHRIAAQMGHGLPVSIEDIIRFMQTKRMHFTPGSASIYSNFGYAILSEVVAKAARMPYEDYVRSHVLAPLGIHDAWLGFSHASDRFDGEASYYEVDTTGLVPDYANPDSLVRRAYGGSDIHTLGSAGGWVISAVDMLKLILSIDGYASIPDQLSPQSVEEMTTPRPNHDPLGWRKVIGGAWFRTGTLAATSAAITRRPDGINFVLIFNSSSGLGPHLAVKATNQMNAAISKVKEWPDVDLLKDDERWVAYRKTKMK